MQATEEGMDLILEALFQGDPSLKLLTQGARRPSLPEIAGLPGGHVADSCRNWWLAPLPKKTGLRIWYGGTPYKHRLVMSSGFLI